MKKYIVLVCVLVISLIVLADVKISQLPLTTDPLVVDASDSFPYYAPLQFPQTRRFQLSDLPATPAFVTKFSLYAPLASPTFSGVLTAPTLVGTLNVSNLEGTISIAQGGTGLLPSGGTAGQVLTTDGVSSYYWSTPSGGGGGSFDMINDQYLTGQLVDTTPINLIGVNDTDAVVIGVASQTLNMNGSSINLSGAGAGVVNLYSPNEFNIASNNNRINFQGNGSASPGLEFQDTTFANYVRFTVPNILTSTYTLVLPGDQGAAGETLQNDGSGNLTWAPGGGSPSFDMANDQYLTGLTTSLFVENLIGMNSSNVVVVGSTGSNTTLTGQDILVQTTGGNNVRVVSQGSVEIESNDSNTLALKNGDGSNPASLIFFDTLSANYFKISAPSTLTNTYTLVFPPDTGSPGQILQTDGTGNLSWVSGGGGGGANLTLSNLTNPIAFNQNFIFGSPGSTKTIQTQDAGSADALVIRSGHSSSGGAGSVTITTGDTSTGADGGEIRLIGGAGNGSAGGNATLEAGEGDGASGGNTFIQGGDGFGGSGGWVNIFSGESDSGPAGRIEISVGLSGVGDGEKVEINGGNATSGNGGIVEITAGGNESTGEKNIVEIRGKTTQLKRVNDGFNLVPQNIGFEGYDGVDVQTILLSAPEPLNTSYSLKLPASPTGIAGALIANDGFGNLYWNQLGGVGNFGDFLQNDGSGNLSWTSLPSDWKRYAVSHTAFTAAATTETINFVSIPAGKNVEQCLFKNQVAFTGGSVTSSTLDFGFTGQPTYYFPGYELTSIAPSGSNFVSAQPIVLDFASSQQLVLTLNTVGGNIATLTAGSLDVYCKEYDLDNLPVTQSFP